MMHNRRTIGSGVQSGQIIRTHIFLSCNLFKVWMSQKNGNSIELMPLKEIRLAENDAHNQNNEW